MKDKSLSVTVEGTSIVVTMPGYVLSDHIFQNRGWARVDAIFGNVGWEGSACSDSQRVWGVCLGSCQRQGTRARLDL